MLIGLIFLTLLFLLGIFLINPKKPSSPTTKSGTTTPTPTHSIISITPPRVDSSQVNSNDVTLTTTGFQPDTLTVKVGIYVTWVNKSGKSATVNSDDHPTHIKYPFLNLGEFKPDSTLQTLFDKAGTYTYHNHFNPSQKGTIIVK